MSDASERKISESQKQYLAGFTMESEVSRAMRGLPILACEGPYVREVH